jgi:hypothetical protein
LAVQLFQGLASFSEAAALAGEALVAFEQRLV